jgi:hypothetical protein
MSVRYVSLFGLAVARIWSIRGEAALERVANQPEAKASQRSIGSSGLAFGSFDTDGMATVRAKRVAQFCRRFCSESAWLDHTRSDRDRRLFSFFRRPQMGQEFVGAWSATQQTGKGLGALYRLALQGEIRHRLDQQGRVQLNREDLGKLRPDYSRRPKDQGPVGSQSTGA